MADVPISAEAPANGVSVNSPTPAAPIAAPTPAPVPAATESPKESFFSGFDWFKVLGYTVLVIVGVSYIKYTRDKAKKDSADITDIKSQLSKIKADLSDIQNPAG